MKAKNKTWIHFVLWGLMILYLFISPKVEARFFIEQGRPLRVDETMLESSNTMHYSLDHTTPVNIEGERVFKVNGWSFLRDDPNQGKYEVFLVLQNDDWNLYYRTYPMKRVDLQKAFSEVEFDLLYRGFYALISKDLLQRSEYRIGFLYQNKENGETIYQATNKQLIWKPNTLQLTLVDQNGE